MRIGFMDSGLGGLTVLKSTAEVLPSAEFIYYADTGNAPYGTKAYEKVHEFVFDIADFMAINKVNAMVLACNTATSVAVNDLRCEYGFPIIGMEPAVKPAVASTEQGKRVLVLATPLTLKEQKFKNLVDRVDMRHVVDILPAPLLVEFAENFEFTGNKVKNYINELFRGRNFSSYSALVLGCTHFIYFKDILKELIPPSILMVDGNNGTVKQIKKVLVERYGQNLVDIYEKGEFKPELVKFFETGGKIMDSCKRMQYVTLL